ncbi:MAG: peptidase S8 [Calditrichaeota bacterium]|nr:MAG: peptidase S8 [Calditrichota bacterium]
MASKKDSSIGSYLYRGGQKLNLAKIPDRFAARLKQRTSPATVAEAYHCQQSRTLERQALTEFSVDAAERDQVMDRIRRGEEVDFASHVYAFENDPASRVYLTDEITVKFKSDVSDEEIEKLASQYGLELVKEVPGMERTFVFRVTSQAKENPIKIANHMLGHDKVEACEPNIVVEAKPYHTPSDPLFAQQWHLFHHGGPFLSPNSHIDAVKAWDITRGERAIVVAVADDSVDLHHVDFQGEGKIVAPRDFGGRDFDPDPELPSDNHGTACAGVAVAEENGTGVVGVAPGCALMPVRTSGFLDDNSIEELFDWVMTKGASVVSCSWGASGINFPLSMRQSNAIHRAATQGRNGLGCVIVFAAGNANRPVSGVVDEKGWPNNLLSGPTRWHGGFAAHPDVIAVSACTSLGKKSAYSNWGKEISVCAPSNNGHPGFFFPGVGPMATYPRITKELPGKGIVTTDRVGPSGYSSTDYTFNFGGTSSACPTVAGVAALVLSANPQLTAKEVKEVLQSTADKIEDHSTDPQLNQALGTYDANGHSPWFGYGKVNAFRAVQESLRRKEGQPSQTFTQKASPARDIPDNDPSGIQEVLQFQQEAILSNIRVHLDISHTYIGDLRVTLVAPNGEAVILHNRNGGSANNLETTYDLTTTPGLNQLLGQPLQGAWTLQVQDLAPLDTGRLNQWELELEGRTDAVVVLEEEAGKMIPDDTPAGIESTLQARTDGVVKNLEVSVDITHSYIGDLSVQLVSPAGTRVSLHHREGGSRDNLLKTFTLATTPGLHGLIGQPIKGSWTLKVADLAQFDKGKLNRWGLKIFRQA